jgi:hypothetical protein
MSRIAMRAVHQQRQKVRGFHKLKRFVLMAYTFAINPCVSTHAGIEMFTVEEMAIKRFQKCALRAIECSMMAFSKYSKFCRWRERMGECEKEIEIH